MARTPARVSRRRLLAAAGAAGAALCLGSPASAAVPVCMVFGHGYAAGKGATAQEAAFPALVAQRFGWQLAVDGIDGTDVDWRANNNTVPGSSGLERVQSKVILAAPNVLVVVFGLTVLDGVVPLDQYQADYTRLLHELHVAGIAPILCVGQPALSATLNDDALGGINSAIAGAVAAVPGCAFLDLAGAWGPDNWPGGSGPVFVAEDGLSPNDAGHADLAARIAERLRTTTTGTRIAVGPSGGSSSAAPQQPLERWLAHEWPFAAAVAACAGIAGWRLARLRR